MGFVQTSTSLGSALTSNASNGWVDMPIGSHPIIKVDAASVTSGATVTIEGRQKGAGLTGSSRSAVRDLVSWAITANGSYVAPVNFLGSQVPGKAEEIRITVSSRTDGSYTAAVLTHAAG